VSDLCFMVLFNFDLGLLAIQVTASIISTSEFDHDTERRKTGTETCIARLGVVLLLFMQCKVISRQEKKNYHLSLETTGHLPLQKQKCFSQKEVKCGGWVHPTKESCNLYFESSSAKLKKNFRCGCMGP